MIYRHALKELKELSKMFSVVLITGARQVGKAGIICMNSELTKLENGNYIIPVNYL